MDSIPQFMIATPASNSGKTTVTLGLLRALKKRNLKVQAFKCGPDYLDTFHHTLASGNQSINLDLFLASENHISNIYKKHSHDKDAVVVESVMGLFDGVQTDDASSATIAKLLGLPVILIVDARAMAYSAGALLHGFKTFDTELNLIGVIFNFVNSETHYNFLKKASEKAGVASFGYLPVNENISIPSRYLGLNISENSRKEILYETAANHLEKYLDLDQILQLTLKTSPGKLSPINIQSNKSKDLSIAVAQDEAFNFIYAENIEKLKSFGSITFFSPLNDDRLPPADFVYLAGGYPELYLDQLSKNQKMLKDIQEYCNNGGKMLAECGGMMYLGSNILDPEGKEFRMTNFLPLTTSMLKKKLHLGYRRFETSDFSIYGHEFHYSSLSVLDTIEEVGKMYNASEKEVDCHMYRKHNTFASYLHSYWAENDSFLKYILTLP